ncbi:MAG: phospholipase [Proteobacteria bacterium]|nr:phospholipase [Pseudomonadota bacterium]
MLSGPEYVPAKADAAIVFLHGYGSNGDDLMGLTPMMAPQLPNTAFFAPNAPQQTVFGMGYQWFSDAGGTFDDRKGIGKAQEQLATYLKTAVWDKHGIKPEKTVLVGFSMGTMTALFVAPRLEQKIAGVAGFSGRLMYADELADGHGHRMPVMLFHGEQDDVVSVNDSREAEKTLHNLGFSVEAKFYDGLAHSIDMRGIGDALAFIKWILNR